MNEAIEICPTCQQPIREGDPVYTITHEHWDCHERKLGVRTKTVKLLPQKHRKRNGIGQSRIRLAKKLQAAFPTRNGLALEWRAEDIQPSTGWYRIRPHQSDTYRWEAVVRFANNASPPFTVGCWNTIKECLDPAVTIVEYSHHELCIVPKKGSSTCSM